MKRIAAIVPAYNEEKAIAAVVEDINSAALPAEYSITAVVVNEVNKICYQGQDYILDETKFTIAKQLKNKLVAIQKGTIEDTHHWVKQVI